MTSSFSDVMNLSDKESCKDSNDNQDPLLLEFDGNNIIESGNNNEGENNSDVMHKKKQKKYVELSTSRKLEVIKYLADHSERSTAKYFGISKTTVNNIKKKQSYYQKLNLQQNSIRRKPIKPTLNINKATLMWLKRVSGSGQRITGVKLQSVALKFADRYKIDFKASTGWLNSFKQRNKINFNRGNQKLKPLFEEPIAIDTQDDLVETMIFDEINTNLFTEIYSNYSDDNVFNVGGCALMYKAFPSNQQSDIFKKDQISILLATSMKGEKLLPLVIGEENLSPPANTSIIWRTNPACLLTREIFNDWLFTLDTEMKQQNRSIVIIIPNLSVYNYKCNNLKNIKLHIVANDNQPLGKGIIKSFKTFYRKLMLESILDRKHNTPLSEVLATITHLDCIHWLITAWNQIDNLIIENNFYRAGYPLQNFTVHNLLLEDIIEMPLLPADVNLNIEKFLSIDNDLEFCKPLDIDDDYLIDDIFNHCKFANDLKISLKGGEISNRSIVEKPKAVVKESKDAKNDNNNPCNTNNSVANEDDEDTDVTSVGDMFIYIGKMKYFALKKLPDMLSSIKDIENLLMSYVSDNNNINNNKFKIHNCISKKKK